MVTDNNIKKLFSKRLKKKQQIQENDISNYSFYKNLNFIPPKPPKTFGFLEKMGMLVFTFNIRFLEVDAVGGSLKRYKNFSDYPNNPHEVIPLRDISICKKIKSMYYSKNYSYFELNYTQRQVYRLISDDCCDKWIECLNASIIYAKFFWRLLQENNFEITKYFSKIKEEISFINYNPEVDSEYLKKQQEFNYKARGVTIKPNDEKKENNNNKEKKKERKKNPFTSQEGNFLI